MATETAMQRRPSESKPQTCEPETKSSQSLGLINALTVLAESFGEPLTPQRLKIYAGDLADIDPARLRTAFTRARRELKFFPKIAELRELAGADEATRQKVEADEAWAFANAYLQKHGVDLWPTYRAGELVRPPRLPARIEYALRRVGGLRGLNDLTSQSRPFAYKAFVEAYEQAPIAEEMHGVLTQLLAGSPKQLKGMEE